jgi:hypothetical protein
MDVMNRIFKLHDKIEDCLNAGGTLFGGIVTKAIELDDDQLKEYIKIGDIDFIFQKKTLDAFTFLINTFGINNVKQTSAIGYGMEEASHYKVTSPNSEGILIRFDISVIINDIKLSALNPRFSVENLKINAQDGKYIIDLLYSHKNCRTVKKAIKHIQQKKLIIVESLEQMSYTANASKFIQRVLRKLPHWKLSDDETTNRVMSARIVNTTDFGNDITFYQLYLHYFNISDKKKMFSELSRLYLIHDYDKYIEYINKTVIIDYNNNILTPTFEFANEYIKYHPEKIYHRIYQEIEQTISLLRKRGVFLIDDQKTIGLDNTIYTSVSTTHINLPCLIFKDYEFISYNKINQNQNTNTIYNLYNSISKALGCLVECDREAEFLLLLQVLPKYYYFQCNYTSHQHSITEKLKKGNLKYLKIIEEFTKHDPNYISTNIYDIQNGTLNSIQYSEAFVMQFITQKSKHDIKSRLEHFIGRKCYYYEHPYGCRQLTFRNFDEVSIKKRILPKKYGMSVSIEFIEYITSIYKFSYYEMVALAHKLLISEDLITARNEITKMLTLLKSVTNNGSPNPEVYGLTSNILHLNDIGLLELYTDYLCENVPVEKQISRMQNIRVYTIRSRVKYHLNLFLIRSYYYYFHIIRYFIKRFPDFIPKNVICESFNDSTHYVKGITDSQFHLLYFFIRGASLP